MGYPYSDDEIAIEPLLNDKMSEVDGLKKNLRVVNMQDAVAGYMPTAQDDAGGGIMYNSFMDKDGNWYIMKSTTVLTVTTYLYYKGSYSTYAASWTGRVGLVYNYFGNIF